MANITIEDLTYTYPNKVNPALDNVSLEIKSGEFVLVLGYSGCGKSTLLRTINRLIPDFHGGKIKGKVKIDGEDIYKMKPTDISSKVGMVFQNPENQIIFSEITKEIVFGMENLNFPYNKMKVNLADVVSYMGITDLIDKKTSELSGGEKQKVAIASILCMKPKILLLDEPTSQLDPVSAENIINTVRRLNEDFGMTIVMIEHRLDKCFHIADRLILVDDGKIAYDGKPEDFIKESLTFNKDFIPVISRIFKKINSNNIPITVKDGKALLKNYIKNNNNKDTSVNTNKDIDNNRVVYSLNKKNRKFNEKLVPVIKFENIYFSYNKKAKQNHNGEKYFALNNINLNINSGDFLSIHGEVGAGKSTLLKLATLELKPKSGKVIINGKNSINLEVKDIAGHIAYLTQNPGDYISQDTVMEEINLSFKNRELSKDNKFNKSITSKTNSDSDKKTIDRNEYINLLLERFNLSTYRKTHPRDLSTGEKQRLAIVSLLMLEPSVIMLDEPTRGLDLRSKSELGKILLELNKQGITIILITHDIEFAHEYAKKSIILSRGEIIAEGETGKVLNQSYSYTTEIGKLFNSKGKDFKNEDEVINYISI